MKFTVKRILTALMLVAALSASAALLSLQPAAEDAADIESTASAAAVAPSRFMGELFFGSDGTTHRVENDQIVLPIGAEKQSVAYSAALTPATYETPSNAVRLILTNYSAASYIHVRYTYATEQGTYTETARVDLMPYSGRCVYPVRIAEADKLVSITFVLPGTEGSSIVLHAMETVRLWTDTVEDLGAINSCRYREDTRTVTVKGSVYHDVMIAAGGGVLGLFRLTPEQTLADVIADPTQAPLVTSALSIGFELQTAAVDVAARYARYAVLICLPDGTRLPLAAPAYATVSQSAVPTVSSRSDFKGIDTVLTSGAIDSNVGSAIVNVYLNRLENDRQSGYLYTVENEYFYFNRDYLAELDTTVRSLSGAACRVYLRFLVEAEGNMLACASAAEGQDAAYLSLRADDTEALRYLHAYTTFLSSRYNGAGQGEIAGIIVGCRVNESDVYNAATAPTLAEYIPFYGQAVNVVATASKSVDPSLITVVPVSDSWNTTLIGHEYRTGRYSAELFAESLAAYLTATHANGFTLMIESDHNPYQLSNAYFEPINTDGEEGPIPEELIPKLVAATQESTYLSSENSILLDTFLQRFLAEYSALSGKYFFHWTPDKNTDGNALSASYVYHYYRLFSDARASAFFVSFREREQGGDLSVFSKIKYLVKYIDTPHGSMRTSFALDIFGVENWGQLIRDFNLEQVEQMTLLEGVFSEAENDATTGSYLLFDFNTSNSTRGWYAGNYCSSLTVSSSDRYGKTLDAVMTATPGTLAEYADIAYRFEPSLLLESAPYITMTIAVDSLDDDAVFEVKMVIGSDTGYMEAKQVVRNGELVTISVNAAQFARIGRVGYIRICAKTVMGEDESFTLHVRDLALHSREYDDATLHTLMEASRQSQDSQRDRGDAMQQDPRLIAILGGSLMLATVIVALMLGHYQKNESDTEE